MAERDTRFEPIRDDFRPVDLVVMRDLEAKLCATLPSAYTEFLSRYGGCAFSGDALVVSDRGRFPVFTFFDGEKLKSNVAIFDDLTADGKLAIADDVEGNIFVLDPVTGSVHFVDFSVNPAVGTKVGDSFEEFLRSIRVEPYS